MTETVWLPDGSGGFTALDDLSSVDHARALQSAVSTLLPRVEGNSDDVSRLLVAVTRLYFRDFVSVDDPGTVDVDESVSPWWKRLFGR